VRNKKSWNQKGLERKKKERVKGEDRIEKLIEKKQEYSIKQKIEQIKRQKLQQ
jgi:hypothetical protein